MSPETKEITGDSIEPQTRQVLDNLKALLEDIGTDLSAAVKTTVFLDNIEDFAEFNQIYAEYFPADPPARSTVEVSRLPLGVLIEVEAIVSLSD
jgi:2-iminobutanoate/2-iminopropanoate deaminase